jgi:hypothetical protein
MKKNTVKKSRVKSCVVCSKPAGKKNIIPFGPVCDACFEIHEAAQSVSKREEQKLEKKFTKLDNLVNNFPESRLFDELDGNEYDIIDANTESERMSAAKRLRRGLEKIYREIDKTMAAAFTTLNRIDNEIENLGTLRRE